MLKPTVPQSTYREKYGANNIIFSKSERAHTRNLRAAHPTSRHFYCTCCMHMQCAEHSMLELTFWWKTKNQPNDNYTTKACTCTVTWTDTCVLCVHTCAKNTTTAASTWTLKKNTTINNINYRGAIYWHHPYNGRRNWCFKVQLVF